jgi:hypothetical protein
MPATKHLIPAPGRTVRDSKSLEALPAEGRAVEMTPFWKRRLADGDVTEGKPTKSSAKPKE